MSDRLSIIKTTHNGEADGRHEYQLLLQEGPSCWTILAHFPISGATQEHGLSPLLMAKLAQSALSPYIEAIKSSFAIPDPTNENQGD